MILSNDIIQLELQEKMLIEKISGCNDMFIVYGLVKQLEAVQNKISELKIA